MPIVVGPINRTRYVIYRGWDVDRARNINRGWSDIGRAIDTGLNLDGTRRHHQTGCKYENLLHSVFLYVFKLGAAH
jgi:hypothetical protein